MTTVFRYPTFLMTAIVAIDEVESFNSRMVKHDKTACYIVVGLEQVVPSGTTVGIKVLISFTSMSEATMSFLKSLVATNIIRDLRTLNTESFATAIWTMEESII